MMRGKSPGNFSTSTTRHIESGTRFGVLKAGALLRLRGHSTSSGGMYVMRTVAGEHLSDAVQPYSNSSQPRYLSAMQRRVLSRMGGTKRPCVTNIAAVPAEMGS